MNYGGSKRTQKNTSHTNTMEQEQETHKGKPKNGALFDKKEGTKTLMKKGPQIHKNLNPKPQIMGNSSKRQNMTQSNVTLNKGKTKTSQRVLFG